MKKLFLLVLPLLAVTFNSCSKDDDGEDTIYIGYGEVSGTVIYNGNSGGLYTSYCLYDMAISDVCISLLNQYHNACMNCDLDLAVQISNSLINLNWIKSSSTSGTTYNIKDVQEGTYLLVVSHMVYYYYPNVYWNKFYADAHQYKVITVNKDEITTANFVFQDFTSYATE